MRMNISFVVSLPPIQLSHISTPQPLTSTLTHSRLDSSPLRLHHLGLTPSLITPHSHTGRQPAKVRYVSLCGHLVERAVTLTVLTLHTAWKRNCQPQSHTNSHRNHMTCPQSHMTSQIPVIWMTFLSGEYTYIM